MKAFFVFLFVPGPPAAAGLISAAHGAFEEFEIARRLRPEQPDTTRGLAQLCLGQTRPARSEAALRRAEQAAARARTPPVPMQ